MQKVESSALVTKIRSTYIATALRDQNPYKHGKEIVNSTNSNFKNVRS